MRDKLIEICRKFLVEGDCVDWRQITNGLINDSYWVEFRKGTKDRQFIVQRLNINVFKSPEKVMSNIERVTEYIKIKYKASSPKHNHRAYMTFYPTIDHKYFYADNCGNFWRISKYIENSIVVNETDDPEIIREIGYAFGKFQADLDGFPAETLFETIKDFHYTPARYAALKNAVLNCKDKRRFSKAHGIIDDLLALENDACILSTLADEGKIKYRVTHNDTKCNNVMLDEDTKKALCVIDLDTVMPGLLLHDFGDAARYICNTTTEDSKDFDSVRIDIDKFKALAEGFIAPLADTITPIEREYLAYSVFVMAIELSVRFMTDYLNGDIYFKKNYEEHNFVRAKCQLSLAINVLENLEQLDAIVFEQTAVATAI